ncbi:MAG: AAA family ATPase [Deltaproteobacteria bacterium]|nr:AAA family ATPase [Deltaproteobacteria bacterium]
MVEPDDDLEGDDDVNETRGVLDSLVGRTSEAYREQPEVPLSRIADKSGRELALLERWVAAIERRGQAVLYGPPGSGKSHMAKELARHLVGGGDGFVRHLVLHGSSSYEDFVQGHRPVVRKDGTTWFPLVRGRFVQFAEDALRRRGTCVLILDEMHRADVGRVLGELVHLLEHRGEPFPLAAGDTSIVLANNIRILGTMSSSDARSDAADLVLRRRFAYLRVTPDPNVLRAFHRETGFEVEGLIAVLARLDHTIRDPDRALGLTYFLRRDLGRTIEDIWRFEVEPTLEILLRDRQSELARFRWDAVRHRIVP